MIALIITPTLGRSPWLAETCASVASLGSRYRHVLVCPRGVADRLRAEYPSCEVRVCEGKGVYAALNCGLAVGGDWDVFTWINDDDRLDTTGAAFGMERLRTRGAWDGVYGRVDYCDARGATLGPLPVERDPRRLTALFAAGLPALSQHGTWVRRRLVEQLKGFDLRYRLAGDFDYWARALAGGAFFGYLPMRVAFYRLRVGQLSGDVTSLGVEIEDSRARYFGRARTRRRLTRLAFRIRHVPDLWLRWKLTGCLRTRSLYAGAAKEALP